MKELLLTILIATSPTSPTVRDVQVATTITKKTYAEYGIKLKVSRVLKVRDKTLKLRQTSAKYVRRAVWVDYKNKNNIRGKLLVVANGMCEGNACGYKGGLSPVCADDGTAIIYSDSPKIFVSMNRKRIAFMMAHEIAHLIGADHDTSDTGNLMYLYIPNSVGSEPFYFTDKSVTEIFTCIGE